MFGIQFYFASLVSLTLSTNWRGHNFYPCSEIVGIVTDFLRVRVVDLVHLKLAINDFTTFVNELFLYCIYLL